jgi:anti-sigma factor RsiW
MLCFLYKWNISRALDTGKPLSRLTKRHLDGCESCREFSRLGREMERRLTEEVRSLLENQTPSVEEKVRKAIAEVRTVPRVPRARPKALSFRPALAAALVLAVLGISVIWLARPQPTGMPRIAPLLELETRRSEVISTLQKAESPYQKEIQGLKRTLLSTADFLAARFQVGLGDNN